MIDPIKRVRIASIAAAVVTAGVGLPSAELVAQEVGSVGRGPYANANYFSEFLTPPDQIVAIRAGRLFDANNGRMLTDQIILIQGERIAAVGRGIDVPSQARVIDLSDATVLPGMIDTHTHPMNLGRTEHLRAYTAVANAQKNLNAGFTTIVDVSARAGYGTVDLRDAINSGMIQGPRMQVTGQSINQRGRSVTPAELPGYQRDYTELMNINSPWLGRAAVRERKLHGVDMVKIYTTWDITGQERDHWNPDGTMHYATPLTYEEVEAIVDEAHRLHLKVVCHTYGGEGLTSCIRAGVDLINHAPDMDDEQFRLLVDSGLPLVPTIDDLVVLEAPDLRATNGQTSRLAKLANVVRRLHNADVDLPFGSGAVGGNIPHGKQGDQFKLLVQWGLTPAEALQTAMTVAARHLNYDWHEHLGAIDTGKLADIIAVAGDPLSDITEMERVRFVMKGGLVVRDELTSREAD